MSVYLVSLPSLTTIKRQSGTSNTVSGFASNDLFLISGRPTLPSEVGIIICDTTNPASLDEMAKQAAVVLNCVGPVSHPPCFVSEQTMYSFPEESGICYSRGT